MIIQFGKTAKATVSKYDVSVFLGFGRGFRPLGQFDSLEDAISFCPAFLDWHKSTPSGDWVGDAKANGRVMQVYVVRKEL